MILLYIFLLSIIHNSSATHYAPPSLDVTTNSNDNAVDQRGDRDGRRKYTYSYYLSCY